MKIDKQFKRIVIVLLIIFIIGASAMILYQKYRYGDIYFNYNGFDVHKVRIKDGFVYQIKIFLNDDPQPYLITSRYSPRDLEEIDIDYNFDDFKKDIIKPMLYITMDSKATSKSVIAATEISKITGSDYFFNVPTAGAMTMEVEGKDIDVKTCDDVDDNTGIIWLKRSDETKIYSENNCVIVEGVDEDKLIMAADRLVLTLLGIMKVNQ